MGWGQKEKENIVDQTTEGNELKARALCGEKKVGLGIVKPIQMEEPIDRPTRQYIINRYHKIYVSRSPTKGQVR